MNGIDSGQYFTSFTLVYVVYILLYSKPCLKRPLITDKTKVLKCMFMIFNILLKLKINISFCTDLISHIVYSSAKLITEVIMLFI